MAKIKRETEPEQLPRLLVSRSQANKELSAQLKIGEELRDRRIDKEAELDSARADRSRWMDFVTLMIKRFISPPSFARDFEYSSSGVYSLDPTLRQKLNYYWDDMQESVNVLRSVIERLPLIDEIATPGGLKPKGPLKDSAVFIVHGHDEAAREMVARFVSRLRLKPVILHEQPNRGRTIIEKFEGHSSVSFAIVLLTPDDVGGKDEAGLKPRARQNVILELGFFCGTLTRSRVCALVKGEVELPSDYLGVLYIPFDDGGAWQMQLAREMKDAGLTIDLNDAYEPRVERGATFEELQDRKSVV